jgi:hypothetical protein
VQRLLTPGRLALRGWDAAVAASVVVLAVVGLALGIGWLATLQSDTTTATVDGPVETVNLDVGSGSATIVGGGPAGVQIRRNRRAAFGRDPVERQSLAGGVLHLSSTCPKVVVGSCSASYRVVVPDGVAVTVRTRGGGVRLSGFRGNAHIETGSGAVSVDAFCGFTLAATTGSGPVSVTTACAPKTVELSSHSGDIRALVPPGRYRIRASSGSGRARVAGVTSTSSAPFTIGLSSGSGNVTLEGGL